MKLVQYHLMMLGRMREADEDYIAGGEGPYFGIKGYIQLASWLAMLKEHRRGEDLPPGWTAYELNALADDKGRLLCLGQLRFGDGGDNVTWAGHIGYSVPPSLRGHGYATQFLRLCLARAWELDFEHVMLTCDVDNAASRRVIEKCGGDFAGIYRNRRYNKLQYWFYNPNKGGSDDEQKSTHQRIG